MLFRQLRDMISPLSCHANTILDHILTQMDEKGISDKKLRKAVAKVQGKGAVCSKDEGRWGKRLVNAEFAAIAVAHNIRKMMQRATVVISV